MNTAENHKKLVFVTGADGLLGSNVVRELLKQGYKVRAMVQKGRKAKTIRNLENVEIVYGDLLEPIKLVGLMKECDMVIHIAAFTASWPSRSRKFFKVNVEGTRNMIDAALYRNIERFVYISSSNTQGFTRSKKHPGNETTPWQGDQGMDYALSKKEAHLMVDKAVEENGLPATIICPGFMFGPYDSGPTSGQLLIKAWHQSIKFATKGGKNFVAARDVATATVNALKEDTIGETFICGNANLTFKELFQMIEDVTGIPQPHTVVPAFLVNIAGFFMDLISKVTHKQPMLSLPMAKNASERMYYGASKAVKKLNMPQTDLRTAIRETYQWFGKNGYLEDYEKHAIQK
ncbi:MAG: NAD-dependent epimerase/dehydratase family protein [Bacteroidetes bacterium]|nr:NAD-dependent epimerase/dehydratase family protein [Bacteroidota bacterium]MCB0844581.1 NAD-dependent epimerase/dehydratase family protein [Bacteroidota bacterium]MCB0852024.1 NAD-dependent epimerase/dehydratase family protein [Bacteroidota bacterium]